MAENKELGMLIDYEYCTGCHSCEVSCKQRFRMHGDDEWGIKLAENGLWQRSDSDYELNYVPVPTESCDMCAGRIAIGKPALCELHCQAQCITVAPVSELIKKMSSKKQLVLFNRTEDVHPREASY